MTVQVTKNSCRQVKLSSAKTHYPRRPHPYRKSTCAVTRWSYSNLTEMLQCHSTWSRRPFPHPPVNPKLFMAGSPDTASSKPAFADYIGFQRSTRDDVERIFNKTASEDDQTDVVYTADDMECFDERKRLATEMDNMIVVV